MNFNFPKYIIYIFSLFLLNSCANKNLKIRQDDYFPTLGPKEDIRHSVYLIGDAGNSQPDEMSPGLASLKRALYTAGENSTVLFLGDNNYPGGIPPKKESIKHAEAISHLDYQFAILENYQGQPIFIPGNHDWRTYGKDGLKRQEDYIESILNAGIDEKINWNNYFLPDNGCPGPNVIEVNDQLVIVAIDTQRWLLNWKKHPGINEGCEIKSREDLIQAYEAVIREHKNKNIIVSLHHPMYTYGTHGKASTVKEHLFPLTQLNNNLYIPIPVLGSLAAWYRALIGSKQDVANSTYKDMRKKLVGPAIENGKIIFASGHDHNLQHIETDGQIFCVSGSGSKESPVLLGKHAEMVFGHQGFSRIDFYTDGSAWIYYYASEFDDKIDQLIFSKKIKEAL